MSLDSVYPGRVRRPPGALTFWVIYDKPTDHPDSYVIRPQFVTAPHETNERYGTVEPLHDRAVIIKCPLAWSAKHPDPLRALMPPGCTYMGRAAEDDPKILEVWME